MPPTSPGPHCIMIRPRCEMDEASLSRVLTPTKRGVNGRKMLSKMVCKFVAGGAEQQDHGAVVQRLLDFHLEGAFQKFQRLEALRTVREIRLPHLVGSPPLHGRRSGHACVVSGGQG